MMIKVVVIPADETRPLRLERMDAADLDGFQRLVGGLIQAVGLSEPDATVFVNEEGKNLGLPANPRATALAWLHNEALRGWDVLAGDAVITGPPDDDGRVTDTPRLLATFLLDAPVVRAQAMRASGEWTDISDPAGDPFIAYQHALRVATASEEAIQVRVVPDGTGQIADPGSGT